jgi:hypothetical protein
MSDPIEKLNRLGDALEGAPMPLPASEIRARGDRIRRRKHAVIAGVSAAVVAAVAVPVVALSLGGDGKDNSQFAPSPSISDPVPSAPLSAENLLTEQDAIWYDAGTDWELNDTYPGDGQSTPNPCFQRSFAGMGASSVFQRDFQWKDRVIGGKDPGPYLNEIIGDFGSPAKARAVYQQIQGWYHDCLPIDAKSFDPGTFTPVDLPVDGEAAHALSTYGPVIKQLDPYGDESWYLDTGLVVSGARIALISALSHGQDYNFERTPVEQMLPAAAERLVLGGGSGIDTPTPSGWPTTIPADFPLSSGWNIDESQDGYSYDAPGKDLESLIEGGELEACGNTAVDPGSTDRLTSRLHYVDDGTARELLLFPSDQEAVTYVAHLRALFEGCPTEGQTPTRMTTDVADGALGDESLVVTRSDAGAHRTVSNVIRVGNGVVVDQAYDQGGPDVGSLVTQTQENLADVMAALNELEGAGTAGDPGDPNASDPAAPAGTTTIPDGFPLDLSLGDPPVADSETTIDGPSADTPGANPETACGVDLAFPNAGSPDPDHELGYSVSSLEGYDGRTIHAYPTAQEAVDQMDLLRSQIQGCSRDSAGDGLSDRIWRTFNADTGYDTLTFGWYYEATEFQGATAGSLYTVSRVGNAILVLDWGGEYSADAQKDQAPDQVELAQRIGDEMDCDFSADGC